MLTIKNITLKNFMSVGAVPQAIRLDEYGLTLILGDNADQGSNGSRNGAGKTVILHAISYALFGTSMTNIKMDNLINKSNKKNMVVTVEFEKNGHTYKIHRGRKPGVFKFFVDDSEVNQADTDEAHGDSRFTQTQIDQVLGFSPLLFKHIIGLSTKTTPFLNEAANARREMIEELLGITQLSEKAAILKELIKDGKAQIDREDFRIKMVIEHNDKTQQTIQDIRNKEIVWKNAHDKNFTTLEANIEKLLEVDIDSEIAGHEKLQAFMVLDKDVRDSERNLKLQKNAFNQIENQVVQIQSNLETLQDKKCHTCGQHLHDDSHTSLIASAEENLAAVCEKYVAQEESLAVVQARYDDKMQQMVVLGERPGVFYTTVVQAYEHKNNLDTSVEKLGVMVDEENPYTEQVSTLQTNNIQEVDYGEVNELNQRKEHQEFLLKLLSDKNSFIRRRIIEQNLGYLNHRLDFYLHKLGLPHSVKFLSDLTVEIVKAGQDFDFDNLSTGESTRLILALSMGFRDMYETLNSPVNLLFIDELIDNGMDTVGGENALAVLKRTTREQSKNIFLVSHKDEFIARVGTVLMVTKESDFTTYQYENDLQV